MRELVRGQTPKEVQQKVDRMKKRNWRQISEIKEDLSQVAYNIIEFVCVMEIDEKPHKERKWGQRYHIN